MLELLVMAAAQATAPPPTARPAPPPVELLEFLGDWSDDEASLIDETDPPPEKAPPAKSGDAKRGEKK